MVLAHHVAQHGGEAIVALASASVVALAGLALTARRSRRRVVGRIPSGGASPPR